MKILIVVIRLNPVDGTEKNLDATNVMGNIANPKSASTIKTRPSSSGVDHPSLWKPAIVTIIKVIVIKNVKKSHRKATIQNVNTFTPLTIWSSFALLCLS